MKPLLIFAPDGDRYGQDERAGTGRNKRKQAETGKSRWRQAEKPGKSPEKVRKKFRKVIGWL